MTGGLSARVQALEATFRAIAETRMAGVAVLHPRVHVEAVDFAACDAERAWGVLITPWFMSLVCLPLERSSERQGAFVHALGEHEIELGWMYESPVGAFACCSLFSPLDAFADHAAARATAQEVMRQLTARPAAAPRPVTRRDLFQRFREAAK